MHFLASLQVAKASFANLVTASRKKEEDGPADTLATVFTATEQLLDVVGGSGRIDPGVVRKVVLMLERIDGIFSWSDEESEKYRGLNLEIEYEGMRSHRELLQQVLAEVRVFCMFLLCTVMLYVYLFC